MSWARKEIDARFRPLDLLGIFAYPEPFVDLPHRLDIWNFTVPVDRLFDTVKYAELWTENLFLEFSFRPLFREIRRDQMPAGESDLGRGIEKFDISQAC